MEIILGGRASRMDDAKILPSKPKLCQFPINSYLTSLLDSRLILSSVLSSWGSLSEMASSGMATIVDSKASSG